MATMAHSESMESSQVLGNNNPYRSQTELAKETPGLELDTRQEHGQSMDTEKQVVSSEEVSQYSDLPMVVEVETPLQPTPQPDREAGKEVTGSWQTTSKEESAPIPVDQEKGDTSRGELLNDVKGPPPAYDSLNLQSRTSNDDFATTPTSIEPDESNVNFPPKPEDRSAVGRFLYWMPPPPSRAANQMPPLIQPVVVPQLDVPPQGESVPFERCYSDVLASHNIPMREFTSFLDGLAMAQAPNSTLQGLKMFGAGVAAVPLPIIPFAGRGLSALATAGSGHSSSRARLYLERAKKEYFEPRGLRLSIVKDPDLSPRLHIPAHAFRLAPLTSSTLTENVSKRRWEGLAPYVAPLRFDVPEQDKQIQGVHKMARKHLESRLKDGSRKLTKMRESQWRCITTTRQAYSNWDERYRAKMAELRDLQISMIREQQSSPEKSGTLKEMMQALDQLQKDVQVLVSERQMIMQNSPDGQRGAEAEMKETSWSRGLKWIVIENIR